MKINRNLINAIVLTVGAFAFGTGCGRQEDCVNQEIGINKPLSDVDGDGKPDVIFALTQHGQDIPYYIFYKKNMGDGTFSEPRFLYSKNSWNLKSEIPLSYFYRDGVDNRQATPQDKYFKSLVDKVEQSYSY